MVLLQKIDLNYKSEGNGETVVLIHGLSDNLLYWEPLVQNLKKDYNVLRFDLRGHGESPLGSDEITADLFADDLKNLLDDLNVKKAHIVGFSLGGVVALNFSVKYPQYVSSLVLMSSFFKCTSSMNEFFNLMLEAVDIGYEEFYDYMVPLVLCPEVIEANKDELEMIKQYNASNANIDAIKKASFACINFDVEDKLCDINVPVLVLAGRYDDISTVEMQNELSDKIKDSEFVVLENVRHNLLVGENISVVSGLLKDFFS